MKVTVSQKGQITIPKRMRLRLGIRPHQVLEIHEEGDRLLLEKCAGRDALDEVFGILKLRRSTDELVARLRGRKPRVWSHRQYELEVGGSMHEKL